MAIIAALTCLLLFESSRQVGEEQRPINYFAVAAGGLLLSFGGIVMTIAEPGSSFGRGEKRHPRWARLGSVGTLVGTALYLASMFRFSGSMHVRAALALAGSLCLAVSFSLIAEYAARLSGCLRGKENGLYARSLGGMVLATGVFESSLDVCLTFYVPPGAVVDGRSPAIIYSILCCFMALIVCFVCFVVTLTQIAYKAIPTSRIVKMPRPIREGP